MGQLAIQTQSSRKSGFSKDSQGMGTGWERSLIITVQRKYLWVDLKSVPPSHRGSLMGWSAKPGLRFLLQFPPSISSRSRGSLCQIQSVEIHPVTLGKVLVTGVGKGSLDPPLYINVGNVLTSLSLCFYTYPPRQDGRIYLAELSWGQNVA